MKSAATLLLERKVTDLETKNRSLETRIKNLEVAEKKQDDKIRDNAKYLGEALKIFERIIPMIQTEETIDFTKILLAKIHEE